MRPFTFNLLLLLQRVDDALRAELRKHRPDGHALARLRGKRRSLAARLRRSMAAPQVVGA